MIIFLYGPDIYRSRQKLNEIVDHYRKAHKSGLNLKYFDGKKLNYQDFKDSFQVISMFKEKKLTVLTNVFYAQDFKERFLKNFEKFINSGDIILFYQEEKIVRNNSLFVFLSKHAKCQEFKLLDSQKLKKWIEKEFSIYQSEIDRKAIQSLIDFVGNDLWRLSNEIKKLASYKKGNKIEMGDVELLVKPKIETDIFKTIEAMAVKNKKQALSLLHKHLEKGDNPLYLLSMINFQFRNLLIIKELIQKNLPYNLLVKESKLHPFVVRKTYSQAQKFELEELKKIYEKIFQIDSKIKTGKIEPQLALDLFISESC